MGNVRGVAAAVDTGQRWELGERGTRAYFKL